MKKVTPTELYEMLCSGQVKFQYKKKDGSIRTAIGTLNPTLITKKPVGGTSPSKEAGYTPYFDLEKNEFRCFLESKLIGAERFSL